MQYLKLNGGMTEMTTTQQIVTALVLPLNFQYNSIIIFIYLLIFFHITESLDQSRDIKEMSQSNFIDLLTKSSSNSRIQTEKKNLLDPKTSNEVWSALRENYLIPSKKNSQVLTINLTYEKTFN